MNSLIVKAIINIIFYIVLIVLGALLALPYITVGKHAISATQHVVDATNKHTATLEREAVLLDYTLDSK